MGHRDVPPERSRDGRDSPEKRPQLGDGSAIVKGVLRIYCGSQLLQLGMFRSTDGAPWPSPLRVLLRGLRDNNPDEPEEPEEPERPRGENGFSRAWNYGAKPHSSALSIRPWCYFLLGPVRT